MTDLTRRLVAEFLGTFGLVLVAVGAAVTGIQTMGPLAVGLAFGLVLAFAVYAFGPVSGCHINPAVTIAMLVSRRMDALVGGLYLVVQFLGALLGAFVLWLLVEQFEVVDQTGALGSNGYGVTINLGGALLIETLLTTFFVLAVLMVTDRIATAALAGVGIGAALAAVHLVGIPLTGTSVNPARSFGPAVFAGGEALEQVWVFLLAPAVGGLLAAAVYRVFSSDDAEAEAGEAVVDERAL
jgi:aquaporin Z